MTIMKSLTAAAFLLSLSALAMGQNAPSPARVAPADAKNHVGESVTVCGNVVDTKTSKYGIRGHGKPITFDLDQPEPNPVFYFVTFATPPADPAEVVAAYQGKRVCVTGKIATTDSGPYIMAADRSQIKIDVAKPDAPAK